MKHISQNVFPPLFSLIALSSLAFASENPATRSCPINITGIFGSYAAAIVKACALEPCIDLLIATRLPLLPSIKISAQEIANGYVLEQSNMVYTVTENALFGATGNPAIKTNGVHNVIINLDGHILSGAPDNCVNAIAIEGESEGVVVHGPGIILNAGKDGATGGAIFVDKRCSGTRVQGIQISNSRSQSLSYGINAHSPISIARTMISGTYESGVCLRNAAGSFITESFVSNCRRSKEHDGNFSIVGEEGEILFHQSLGIAPNQHDFWDTTQALSPEAENDLLNDTYFTPTNRACTFLKMQQQAIQLNTKFSCMKTKATCLLTILDSSAPGVVNCNIKGVTDDDSKHISGITPITQNSLSKENAVGYTITKPGAYRIIEDLKADPRNRTAVIQIASDNVLLDLNGRVIDANNISSSCIRMDKTEMVSISNGTLANSTKNSITLTQAHNIVLRSLTTKQTTQHNAQPFTFCPASSNVWIDRCHPACKSYNAHNSIIITHDTDEVIS